MRVAVPVLLVAVVAAGSVAPAAAAPKRAPIKHSYDVALRPLPDPTEDAACQSTLRSDLNRHVHGVKVGGSGRLVVKVTGFTGDWDLALHDATGKLLRQGWGSNTPGTLTETAPAENLWYRNFKAQTLYLRLCNVLGSERAKVSYTYTYY